MAAHRTSESPPTGSRREHESPGDPSPGSWFDAIVVFLAVLATRIPFLGPGYGLDADAWRVALAARTIADTGSYRYSRMPGHAPHELIVALRAHAPAEFWLMVTAVVSAAAAVLFWRLLGRYRVRDRWLATLAFALTPVIYIESVQMLDYMWSLACILGAVLATLRGRRMLGGALLGLATGFSITTALMGVPLVLLAVGTPTPATSWRERITAAAAVTGPAVAVALLCFAPAYLAYGPGFLSAPAANEKSPIVAAWIASVGVWGLPGAAIVAIVTAATLWRLTRQGVYETSMARRPSAPVVAAWLSVLILYAIFYNQIRGEPSKLIPMVPFVLLLLARWAERRAFVAVCIAVIVSPFVGQVLKPLLPAIPSIVDDSHMRHREMNRLHAIWNELTAESGPVVLISGSAFEPKLAMTAPESPTEGVRIQGWATAKDIEAWRAAGARVYCLPEACAWNKQRMGIDPRDLGALVLQER